MYTIVLKSLTWCVAILKLNKILINLKYLLFHAILFYLLMYIWMIQWNLHQNLNTLIILNSCFKLYYFWTYTHANHNSKLMTELPSSIKTTELASHTKKFWMYATFVKRFKDLGLIIICNLEFLLTSCHAIILQIALLNDSSFFCSSCPFLFFILKFCFACNISWIERTLEWNTSSCVATHLLQ